MVPESLNDTMLKGKGNTDPAPNFQDSHTRVQSERKCKPEKGAGEATAVGMH